MGPLPLRAAEFSTAVAQRQDRGVGGGMMVLFELDGRDVAERFVQPVVVVPGDPFDGRELELRPG